MEIFVYVNGLLLIIGETLIEIVFI